MRNIRDTHVVRDDSGLWQNKKKSEIYAYSEVICNLMANFHENAHVLFSHWHRTFSGTQTPDLTHVGDTLY